MGLRGGVSTSGVSHADSRAMFQLAGDLGRVAVAHRRSFHFGEESELCAGLLARRCQGVVFGTNVPTGKVYRVKLGGVLPVGLGACAALRGGFRKVPGLWSLLVAVDPSHATWVYLKQISYDFIIPCHPLLAVLSTMKNCALWMPW